MKAGVAAMGTSNPILSRKTDPPHVVDAAPEHGEDDAHSVGSVAGPRFAADAFVRVNGGRLSYYSKYKNFEATCPNKEHGCCKMTRRPFAKFVGPDGDPRGGRPIAFMAGYLSLAFVAKDRATHKSEEFLRRHLGPQEARMVHRASVLAWPGGDALVSKERKRGASEPVEPVDLLGTIK